MFDDFEISRFMISIMNKYADNKLKDTNGGERKSVLLP